MPANPASRSSSIAILSYHKIGRPAPGGWETWYYVPEPTFEAHLQLLRERGYTCIDLPAFYRGLDDPAAWPAKPALITFDDAYRNVRTDALPIMRRMGVPGVVFVPTQYVGGLNSFDSGREPDEPICDWDDLLALEAGGVAVESHSVSHPAFSLLTPSQQEDELVRSKEALEARLHREVTFFAYPYGDAGNDAALSEATLKRAGYRAACLYGGWPVPLPVPDRFRLERLAMGADSNLPLLLRDEPV